MDTDKVLSEARARIIWGESSASVRGFLVSNGISDLVAEAKVSEFELERNREVRRIGLRNVVTGGLLVGAAGVTLYMALPLANGLTSGWNRGLALVLLGGVYGLWKLVKGVIRLVRPQSEHKSVPDIDQAEAIE